MKVNPLESKGSPTLAIPDVYKLIEKGASSDILAQQLYTDFYSPQRDAEKVFLAIEGIRSRGYEGEAALRYLSSGTDELGALLNNILARNLNSSELEKVLGIKRFPDYTDFNHTDKITAYRRAHEHAVRKGYTTLPFSKCMEILRNNDLEDREAPHLTGEIEDELFTESASFGTKEPAYLEVIGTREILRLRSMKEPSFLLLGSYGPYSANELQKYANKINPKNKVFVIDNTKSSVDKIHEAPDTGILAAADAERLPFKSDSMDHIYTNFLIRFIDSDISATTNIFNEAFRVLKSKGSFVLCESPSNGFPGGKEAFLAFIKRMAIKTGFTIEKIDESSFAFMLRPEVSSSKIDANGFPHYDAAMSLSQKLYSISFRLVKP